MSTADPRDGRSVQDVAAAELQQRLRESGQALAI